jgi:ribosome-associated heat shock protein Hsp15
VERVRIDKWLWAARFFKTRALASHACDLGRVEIRGQAVKPSRALQAGEFVKVTTEGGVFEIEILALSEMRGPAAVAQTLYRETEESRAARQAAAEARRLEPRFESAWDGRPSKRDRRALNRFRGF